MTEWELENSLSKLEKNIRKLVFAEVDPEAIDSLPF